MHLRIFKPSSASFLILLLLSTALLGLLVAPERALALNHFQVYLAGALVFAVAAWGGRKTGGLFAGATILLLIGVVAALLSLVTTDWAAGQIIPGLPLSGRFPVLLRLPGSGVPNPAAGANPRMVAGTMTLFLPLALSLALYGRKPTLRLLGGLVSLVLLLPLYLSQSPQGLLALGLGLGLVLAFRSPRSLLPLVALALLLALSWSLWHWGLPAALVQRLLLGIHARLQIWPVTLLMLGDMPYTGIGLNNFPTVQPFYSFHLAPQPHAHNVFLQTALDQGVIGLLAFLALFALAFRLAWHSYRQHPDPHQRLALLGLAGGCAAYLGYGLWDSMTLGNKPALAVWAMLGLLISLAAPPLSPSIRKRSDAPLPPLSQSPALTHARSPASPRRLLLPLSVAALTALVLLAAPFWGSALLVNAGRLLYHPLAMHAAPVDGGRLVRVIWITDTAEIKHFSRGRLGILRGYALLLAGRDPQAILTLKRSLTRGPRDERAHLVLADACHRLGELACALEHWRLAGAYPLLLDRGRSYYEDADYPAAQIWFSLAIAVDPTQTAGWTGLLAAQKNHGQWSLARRTAQEFQLAFPALSAPYEELAAILIRLDQPDSLDQLLERAFRQAQPPGAQLYYLRSRQSALRQRYPAAEGDARQAIALQPGNGAYLAWLGDLYHRQGRYSEAIAQYRFAARQADSPNWVWRLHQRIGSTFAAQGLWPQAVDAYRQAVALSQAQPVAPFALAQNYAALGSILKQSGDLPGAEAAFTQALQLDPQNQDALKALSALGSP